MILGLEHLDSDFDRAEYMQNMLVKRATGGVGNNFHYVQLREHFLSNLALSNLIPRWVKVNRDLDQFWQFIKQEYRSYAKRRNFIRDEFNGLLEFLESKQTLPPEKTISEHLKNFAGGVHFAWNKALERKTTDSEGAITMSRTILESACKHILDAKGIQYDSSKIELSELYKKTAKELRLAPEQHNEQIFKQILGGCSAVVNGLGALRNKLGDAHGKGKSPVKPNSRHADLAVNLAGSMASFLIQTYEANKT